MKRKERAVRTETALKDAAKRLFATRGYLNTKITDITAEAGRAAGSFYNHFSSKEELLESLLADLAAAGDAAAGVQEHKADFTDPDAVRMHVAAYWNLYREHASTMLALRQAALVNEEFAGRLRRFTDEQLRDIAGHLAYVRDLPGDVDVSLKLMAATMDGIAQWRPDLPDEEAIEIVTRFVYRGLNGTDY